MTLRRKNNIIRASRSISNRSVLIRLTMEQARIFIDDILTVQSKSKCDTMTINLYDDGQYSITTNLTIDRIKSDSNL